MAALRKRIKLDVMDAWDMPCPICGSTRSIKDLWRNEGESPGKCKYKWSCKKRQEARVKARVPSAAFIKQCEDARDHEEDE
jgi:hypothetical protein